ncbi:hypothetical protein DMUE_0838 [Dictyocoela muelleri]|nr:hypothetical protein DMUE_0838 [Dictyocoela muelleri]
MITSVECNDKNVKKINNNSNKFNNNNNSNKFNNNKNNFNNINNFNVNNQSTNDNNQSTFTNSSTFNNNLQKDNQSISSYSMTNQQNYNQLLKIPSLDYLRSNSLNITILYEKSVDPAVSHTNNSLINSLINQYNSIFMDFGFSIRIDEILSYSEYYQIRKYYELASKAGSNDFEGRRNIINKLMITNKDSNYPYGKTNYVFMGVSSSDEDDIENKKRIFLKSDLKDIKIINRIEDSSYENKIRSKDDDNPDYSNYINVNNTNYSNYSNNNITNNTNFTNDNNTNHSNDNNTNHSNNNDTNHSNSNDNNGNYSDDYKFKKFDCTGIFLFNFDSISNLYSDTLTVILKYLKKFIGEILNIEIPDVMNKTSTKEMSDFLESLEKLNIRDKIKKCYCRNNCNDLNFYELKDTEIKNDKNENKPFLNKNGDIKEFNDYESLIKKFEEFIAEESNGKSENKGINDSISKQTNDSISNGNNGSISKGTNDSISKGSNDLISKRTDDSIKRTDDSIEKNLKTIDSLPNNSLPNNSLPNNSLNNFKNPNSTNDEEKTFNNANNTNTINNSEINISNSKPEDSLLKPKLGNISEKTLNSSKTIEENVLNTRFSDIYTKALQTISNYQISPLKSPLAPNQSNFLNMANSETNKTLNELISTLKELIVKEEKNEGKFKNLKSGVERKIERGKVEIGTVERSKLETNKKNTINNRLSYGITRRLRDV